MFLEPHYLVTLFIPIYYTFINRSLNHGINSNRTIAKITHSPNTINTTNLFSSKTGWGGKTWKTYRKCTPLNYTGSYKQNKVSIYIYISRCDNG